MSDETKVTVSAGELAMAADKGVILTKRAVIEKASALFSSKIPDINNIFRVQFADDKILSTAVPKISKGENYRGFPYVIMDHPACFVKGNLFAVRTMFHWGHYFSIHLHLSGEYKNAFQKNILKNMASGKDFIIATGEKEWEHHFEETNYIPFSSCSAAELQKAEEKEFLKIAIKYELHHWNMMQSILSEGYKKIADLLKY